MKPSETVLVHLTRKEMELIVDGLSDTIQALRCQVGMGYGEKQLKEKKDRLAMAETLQQRVVEAMDRCGGAKP